MTKHHVKIEPIVSSPDGRGSSACDVTASLTDHSRGCLTISARFFVTDSMPPDTAGTALAEAVLTRLPPAPCVVEIDMHKISPKMIISSFANAFWKKLGWGIRVEWKTAFPFQKKVLEMAYLPPPKGTAVYSSARYLDWSVDVGPDIDTQEKQYTHIVIGTSHKDTRPLCGRETLWGHYPGKMSDVTCPYCLLGIKAAHKGSNEQENTMIKPIASVKPITPQEALDNQGKHIPSEVIELFNQVILENLQGDRSEIGQNYLVERICEVLKVAREVVFAKGWLNVEKLYHDAGWLVEYDKPGMGETYEAKFIFYVPKGMVT